MKDLGHNAVSSWVTHKTRKQISPKALELHEVEAGKDYLYHDAHETQRFTLIKTDGNHAYVLFAATRIERRFTLGDIGLQAYSSGVWNDTNYVTHLD